MKNARIAVAAWWALLAVLVLWLTFDDGTVTRLFGALVAFAAAWFAYQRFTTPDTPDGERPVAPVAEKFGGDQLARDPLGEHRVVLQVTGSRPVAVIREIRRTTGKDLISAKDLAEQAPVIVVENLSEASAAAVAERLAGAGARATAAPMDTHL